MHKDVVYARFYGAFFQAHPEMLTEVRYIPMPDGEEPALVLSVPAVRCLLAWGVAEAYLTDMPRTAALRKVLQAIGAGSAAPDDPAHRVRRPPRRSALCLQARRGRLQPFFVGEGTTTSL